MKEVLRLYSVRRMSDIVGLEITCHGDSRYVPYLVIEYTLSVATHATSYSNSLALKNTKCRILFVIKSNPHNPQKDFLIHTWCIWWENRLIWRIYCQFIALWQAGLYSARYHFLYVISVLYTTYMTLDFCIHFIGNLIIKHATWFSILMPNDMWNECVPLSSISRLLKVIINPIKVIYVL